MKIGGRDRIRTRKRQCAVVFKTTALPVRLPFHPESLVHVVGLATTKGCKVHLIYSQEPLLLGAHMQSVLQNRRRQREHCIEHTSRHTSPEDGDLADSRKAPRSSSEKAPCLRLSQKLTSIVKKLKERASNFPGKLPAPSILLVLLLRLGAGSAPADYCLVWRLFMDCSCPSRPSKSFVGNEPRPKEQTTIVTAHGGRFIDCSFCLRLINIFLVRKQVFARTVLYKVSIQTLSRFFFATFCTIVGVQIKDANRGGTDVQQ